LRLLIPFLEISDFIKANNSDNRVLKTSCWQSQNAYFELKILKLWLVAFISQNYFGNLCHLLGITYLLFY